MRENERFCYLDEVYKFLGLPYGEFENDEIYEKISEENYLFLKNELPEDKWFESINAINGLLQNQHLLEHPFSSKLDTLINLYVN